ncbi:MAG TPA: hypothetical protein VG273_21905 [Bryobacteraceae bacterium]|jgi:hypothetical protein|nr:hypothetical protein [Bryobacteraceae bacterium]
MDYDEIVAAVGLLQRAVVELSEEQVKLMQTINLQSKVITLLNTALNGHQKAIDAIIAIGSTAPAAPVCGWVN